MAVRWALQVEKAFCLPSAKWILKMAIPMRVYTSGEEPAFQEMLEMWVRFLGLEEPLEDGMAIPSSILA